MKTKTTREEPAHEFSPFNIELVDKLKDAVPGFAMDFSKQTVVPLSADVDGHRITFATIRKGGRSRTADLLLNGYMPDKTGLTANQQADVRTVQASSSAYYLYRTHSIVRAVKALQVHFRDIKKRIKAGPTGKGSMGRPKGIPKSYYAE